MNDNTIAIVSAIDFTLRVLLTGQIKAIQHEGFEMHGLCSPGREFDRSKLADRFESILTEAVQ